MHTHFFFSYPYSSVCIWKMQEKESLLANLRLTTSQATSNQTAAVYTSPVPTEGLKIWGTPTYITHDRIRWYRTWRNGLRY